MKNVMKLVAVIALAALIGFGMASCGGGAEDTTPRVNGVTVNSGSFIVVRGTTMKFNAVVSAANNPETTVTWTVSGGGAGTDIDEDGLLTVAAGETAESLTVTATSTFNTARSGSKTVFVSDTQADGSFVVNSAASLNSAFEEIRNGGDNKTYTIQVSGNFSLGSNTYYQYTFGTVNNLTVFFSGNSTITMTGYNYIMRLSSSQKVIIIDVKFRGYSNNLYSMVAIEGGEVIMAGSASISDNKIISTFNPSLFKGGSAVYIIDNGSLTMQDYAQIRGNNAPDAIESSDGGGVFVEWGNLTMKDNAAILDNHANSRGSGVYVGFRGKFTMQDNSYLINNTDLNIWNRSGGVYVDGSSSNQGEFTMMDDAQIRGNSTGSYGGGVTVSNGIFNMMDRAAVTGNYANRGGGVYVYSDGIFRISGGSITDNTAFNSFANLYVWSGGGSATPIAERGTFIGGVWTPKGTLDSTDDPIIVVDGELQ